MALFFSKFQNTLLYIHTQKRWYYHLMEILYTTLLLQGVRPCFTCYFSHDCIDSECSMCIVARKFENLFSIVQKYYYYYYSPQSFEVNLNPTLLFFLSSFRMTFLKIKDFAFSLGLQGFYMFPIVVLSGWACLVVLGHAWACMSMLGRALVTFLVTFEAIFCSNNI